MPCNRCHSSITQTHIDFSLNAHRMSIYNSVNTSVGLWMVVVVSVMIKWVGGWKRTALNNSLLSTLLLHCHSLITLIRFKEGMKNDGVTHTSHAQESAIVTAWQWTGPLWTGRPWVGCVFLAWFNDAEAEWCASELAKVPQFPALGGTGTPPACKNNARGYTCTWPPLIF